VSLSAAIRTWKWNAAVDDLVKGLKVWRLRTPWWNSRAIIGGLTLAFVWMGILWPDLIPQTVSYAATHNMKVDCSGESCDNLRPKPNGCTTDKRILSGISDTLQVYYSDSCDAIWIHRTSEPLQSRQLHVEVQRRTAAQWKTVTTLVSKPSSGKPATSKMMGARDSTYRFRGLNVDSFDGSFGATEWVNRGTMPEISCPPQRERTKKDIYRRLVKYAAINCLVDNIFR
jgi:hypothetical protein